MPRDSTRTSITESANGTKARAKHRGQARLRQATEVSDVSVLGGIDLSKYSGVDDLDTDERETGFIEMQAQRRLTRSTLQMNASLRRQDLLRFTRVLDGADPFDDDEEGVEEDDGILFDDELPVEDDLITGDDVDLGSTEQLVQRDVIRVSPSVSYALSELTNIGLSFGYYERSYDDPSDSTNFQDSESRSVAVQVQRALTPRSSLTLSMDYSEFEPERSLESDSYSLVASWRRAMSALTTLTLSAGARKTETDVFDDTGGLFSARLDRRTDTGKLYVLVERKLAASGFGNQVETDRVSFGFDNRITQRLAWGVSARAYQTERLSDTQNSSNRDYFQIAPSLQWSVARDWRLRFSYRYTFIDRDTQNGDVSRNSAGLSLEYAPPKRI